MATIQITKEVVKEVLRDKRGRELLRAAAAISQCQVVSQEEAEKGEFVICGPNSYFADDIYTQCSRCGARICHRPHAPKRPPKICIECFEKGELYASNPNS